MRRPTSPPCSGSGVRSRGKLALVAALAAAACTAGRVNYSRPVPSSAEALSLLGDTLWTLPLDPATGPGRITRLNAARAMFANNPTSVSTQLALARSLVSVGRFREAVETIGVGIEGAPLDARLYRLRGELLLWLRELPLAIKDLRRVPPSRTSQAAFPDIVELPGEAATVAMLEYQRLLLLGFAQYCDGRFKEARESFLKAIPAAGDADELARLLLWTWFAVRRTGRLQESRLVLEAVDSTWLAKSDRPEVKLLLVYKGFLPADSLRHWATARSDTLRALSSYAVGYLYALDPARREDAELWLANARTARNWATMPYLAAEAELARLRRRP